MTKTRKLLLSLAILFHSLLLAASPMKEKEMRLDLLTTIQGRGDIVFAVEKEQFPYVYHDEKHRLTGYSIEVANQIAQELGSKASFIEKDEDILWTGLADGRYDLVMNIHSTISKELFSANFENSSAYLPMKAAVITRKNNDSILSPSDLKGRSTTTLRQPEYIKMAERYDAFYISLDSIDEVLSLVENGSIEAAIAPLDAFSLYIKQNKSSELQIIGVTKDIASDLTLVLRKGDESKDMRKAVNKAISELKKNGTLSALSLKYFHYDVLGKKANTANN